MGIRDINEDTVIILLDESSNTKSLDAYYINMIELIKETEK